MEKVDLWSARSIGTPVIYRGKEHVTKSTAFTISGGLSRILLTGPGGPESVSLWEVTPA